MSARLLPSQGEPPEGRLTFEAASADEFLDAALALVRKPRARLTRDRAAAGGGIAVILAAAGFGAYQDAHAAESEGFAAAAGADDILAFAEVCAPGAALAGEEGADHALHERGALDAPFADQQSGCGDPFASRFGGLEEHAHEGTARAHEAASSHHSGAGHDAAAMAMAGHAGHGAGAAHGSHAAEPSEPGQPHAEAAAGHGRHAAASDAHSHDANAHDVAEAPAGAGHQGHGASHGPDLVIDFSAEPDAGEVAIDLDRLDMDEALAALLGEDAPAASSSGDIHAGHGAPALALLDDAPADAILPPSTDI